MACCSIRDKVSSFIRRNKVSRGVVLTLSDVIAAARLAAREALLGGLFDRFRADKISPCSIFGSLLDRHDRETIILPNTTDPNRGDDDCRLRHQLSSI
jgi:hypothetical protein